MLDIASKDKSIVGLRDFAILQMLFSTGLRVSELANLHIDMINPRLDEFTVKAKAISTVLCFCRARACCYEGIRRQSKRRIAFFSLSATTVRTKTATRRHSRRVPSSALSTTTPAWPASPNASLPYPPPHLRHGPPPKRRRHPQRPVPPRPRVDYDDASLHARDGQRVKEGVYAVSWEGAALKQEPPTERAAPRAATDEFLL